jgi:hypothetical protein
MVAWEPGGSKDGKRYQKVPGVRKIGSLLAGAREPGEWFGGDLGVSGPPKKTAIDGSEKKISLEHGSGKTYCLLEVYLKG